MTFFYNSRSFDKHLKKELQVSAEEQWAKQHKHISLSMTGSQGCEPLSPQGLLKVNAWTTTVHPMFNRLL